MTNDTNPLDGITLRDYRPGDADAMHALDLECFQPPFRFTSRAMRRFAEEPHAITLLAERRAGESRSPELAGFIVTHMEGQTAYIVTLDIAAGFRRRGLARLLIREAEARAQAAGAEEMALHVFTGNAAAIGLYESLGYDRARLAEDFYAPGVHAMVYRKSPS